MRQFLVSLTLGLGLVVTGAGQVLAQPAPAGQTPGQATTAAEARQALQDFLDYTAQNWSVQGYSSVEEMRYQLGYAQSGWLRDVMAAAGATPIDIFGNVDTNRLDVAGTLNSGTVNPGAEVHEQQKRHTRDRDSR
jgi:hypothetical protein